MCWKDGVFHPISHSQWDPPLNLSSSWDLVFLPNASRSLTLLQNIDSATLSCNTFINVLQRSFMGTQNFVLQASVVTHSTRFVKLF
jgi:hypothetical protein